jgi:hypothetical protein
MLAKASIQSWHCASVAMIAPPAWWMLAFASMTGFLGQEWL